jgi:glycerate kinase
VTGEGALDAQTLRGKAPAGVAAAARAFGVPVVAVAGRIALPAEQLRAAGIAAAYALLDLEPDLSRAIADAGPLLERLAVRLADDWLAGERLTT